TDNYERTAVVPVPSGVPVVDPRWVGEGRSDVPQMLRMGVTVKVEALARQHEDALGVVEVLEDVAQRRQALLLAGAVDGRQAAIEQGHERATDGAVPRPAQQTSRGEAPRTGGGPSGLGDDVDVVHEQSRRHARP